MPFHSLNISLTLSGDLRFDFLGWDYAEYLLERSTDLEKWTPVSTNQAGDKPLIIESRPDPSARAEFWRMRLLQ